MLISFLALAAVTFSCAAPPEPGTADLKPVQLRCEYQVDPVGIDTARPHLSWVLESGRRGQSQTAYEVRVDPDVKALDEDGKAFWDSGRVTFSEQNQIEYNGPPLGTHHEYFWSVRVWDQDGNASVWSTPARWTTALLHPEDWKAAWITAPRQVAEAPDASGPLPLFRKDFQVLKPVRRALLHVCGLGFHEARLNGQSVTSEVYAPGWTNYKKTCLYSTYDVTPVIREKDNTLGVILGNGMYNVAGGRYVKFKGSFGAPQLILQLHLEYADGSTQEVVSNASWRVASGPTVFSCMYGGEDYDAQREIPGWDAPGFDASAWAVAIRAQGPGGRLVSALGPPIQVMQTLNTQHVTALPEGGYVYDLGQNFSGRPCIRVRGPRGATVKLTPGELLDETGHASQRSSGSPVSFSYTLKGGEDEVWRPSFTYYGFRYLQVDGARSAAVPGGNAALPELMEVTGEFTYASAAEAGAFSCGNELVNRVHNLILAAIRSNLQSVLTDCPHREKLGWLEVSHLLADGLLYNFDLARFYAKIQQDMMDSQIDSGLVPDIAPEYTVFNAGFRDSPEWGSASLVNPWNVYLMYGDRRNLETHYGEMERYTAYLENAARWHIVSHGLGDWYDVGPKNPGESQLTSKGLTATAVYYQDLCILQQTAALLGKADTAKATGEKAEEVRAAFNKTFYNAKERYYDRNSQTANAMPLILGLTEDAQREAVTKTLVSGIEAARYHVTAGDVGFSYLVRALTEAEQGNVLYKMVCQNEGPGYACQLGKGATTLTEAWDANPASSQNHCMLGHVEGWFYRGLAGIRVDTAAPGFRHFILRPQFPEGLDSVKAHYDSMRGRIVSEWKIGPSDVSWNVSIPPNTSATVYVPAGRVEDVSEGGKPLGQAEALSSVRAGSGGVAFEAASGEYCFRWTPLVRCN